MTRFIYTPEMLQFIKQGYRKMMIPELTEAFNKEFSLDKAVSQIRACINNHGFLSGRKPGGIPRLTLFTEPQRRFIATEYQRGTIDQVTEAVNKQFSTSYTASQVRAFTRNHGITSGRTGRFEKGHKTWNRGKKGWTAGGRSAETRFKKGRKPEEASNYRPIGSVRISKDGYLERKVSDDHEVTTRRWEAEHRLVWSEANGPIPEGHVVVFLDGDPMNVNLNNLRCVHRGVLSRMNKQIRGQYGEARKAAILTCEIEQVAHELAGGEK